ncbi:hypothetical protein BHE74_00053312 [Ensete ventricosum]|nr:hypothetical protein BHE74_00053312 [Ensete ventricosum]
MISPSSLAFSTPRIRSPSLPSSSLSSSSSRRSRRLLWPRCATTAVPPPAAAATLYDVLGIPAGATVGEIKAAYRRLARVCHPDVAAASTVPPADEFIRVHAAYATLSDPEKRAEYDRRVMAAAASSMASATWGIEEIAGGNEGYRDGRGIRAHDSRPCKMKRRVLGALLALAVLLLVFSVAHKEV